MAIPQGTVVAEVAGTYTSNPTATVSMTPIEARKFVLKDALNRAARTAWNAVGWDVAIAVAFVLSAAIGDMEWTTAWWAAIGTAVFKTVVTTITAYIARRRAAPKVGVQV